MGDESNKLLKPKTYIRTNYRRNRSNDFSEMLDRFMKLAKTQEENLKEKNKKLRAKVKKLEKENDDLRSKFNLRSREECVIDNV